MPNYWDGVTSSNANQNDSEEHIKTDPSVPVGFYACEVIDFGAWPSKDDPSQWSVKWTMRIVGESVQRGKYLVRWSSMTPEKAPKNFDLFTNSLGRLPAFDPDHGFADLRGLRQQMVGAVVKVKHASWEYQGRKGLTAHINQLVTPGGQDDPHSSAPTSSESVSETIDDEDENIPF